METLGNAIKHGYSLTAHCEARPGHTHYSKIDTSALLKKFGPDITIVSLNRRLICKQCGARAGRIHLDPPGAAKDTGGAHRH